MIYSRFHSVLNMKKICCIMGTSARATMIAYRVISLHSSYTGDSSTWKFRSKATAINASKYD